MCRHREHVSRVTRLTSPVGACVFACISFFSQKKSADIFLGVILGLGAKLISDGAEGVLELWPAYGSVIGALLLPVLGALPDSESSSFGFSHVGEVVVF